MANFTSKVQELLHSPKAREMVDKAKTAANKPENREKFRQLSSKLTGRGRGPGSHTPHASTTSSTSSTSDVGSTPGSFGSSGSSGSFGGDDRSAAERDRSDYGPF